MIKKNYMLNALKPKLDTSLALFLSMLNTLKPKQDISRAPFSNNVDYAVCNSNQIFRWPNNKKLENLRFYVLYVIQCSKMLWFMLNFQQV